MRSRCQLESAAGQPPARAPKQQQWNETAFGCRKDVTGAVRHGRGRHARQGNEHRADKEGIGEQRIAGARRARPQKHRAGAELHQQREAVCDRPNPIGGVAIEGPTLEPGYESFVGLYRMPMRHGMTVGELARLFNEHHRLGAELEVVTMEGWSRDMYWDDTGLFWVIPSPNMPTLDTAIVYPGTVLFEGTMLSEGRGTTRPFELLGAPWIDADGFAARMNAVGLDGVHFRPAIFEPTFQKHARTTCGGCQIHVTSRQDFAPVEVGVSLLREFHGMAPKQFKWRDPPYEYEHDKMPIDILAGSPDAARADRAAGAAG